MWFIISLISVFYTQFRENQVIATALQVMRVGVAAVIFDVVVNLSKNVCKTKRILYISLMFAAFLATTIFDISAMLIILICLGIGLTDAMLSMIRKNEKKEVLES